MGSLKIPGHLVLLSQDVVSEWENNEAGTDLLRRACYSYAGQHLDKSNTGLYDSEYAPYLYIQEPAFGTISRLNSSTRRISVADPDRFRTSGNHPLQVQFVTTNGYNITNIDDNVIVPNIKIPFRIYAEGEYGIVQGDEHWRTFFMGGTWSGNSLPQRFNRERIFYDCSTVIKYPYSEQDNNALEYLGLSDKFSSFCTIKTNYYDYNYNASQYQEWASEQTSELLIPNLNLLPKYIIKSKMTDTAGTLGEFGAGAAEFAAGFQASWLESDSKVFAYHFPVGSYYDELKKDQYFGTYFPQTSENEQYKQDAINSQKNIIFDSSFYGVHQYSAAGASGDDFLNRTLIDDMEAYGTPLQNKLSTFYNVEIKFQRHGNSKLSEDALSNPENFRDSAGGPGDPIDSRDDRNHDANLLKLQNDYDAINYQLKQNFRINIQDSNFDSRFMELLKDLDNGSITDINVKKLPFNYGIFRDKITYDSGIPISNAGYSWGENSNLESPKTSIGLKSINFLELLSYAYNNPESELNNDYIFAQHPLSKDAAYGLGFIGGGISHVRAPRQAATQRDDNMSRNLNNIGISKLIESSTQILKEYVAEFMTIASLEDALDSTPASSPRTLALDKIYGPNMHFNEVLAYKIEKIGGTPVGDGSNQEVLQKFWIYNSYQAPAVINLLDSQVKYGENYTYKITAYTLILSHKYKYDDFRLTKQIGVGNYLGSDASAEEYCLQFYDPFDDNNVAASVFTTADDSLSDLSEISEISSFNDFAPSSVEISKYPQLAEFNLYVEPCLELVEIPFFQKTIKVMDHPPNVCNVAPFHFIDNSNRVGFKIQQESFIKRPYPELVTLQDLNTKADYLNSKAVPPYNLISNFSESPARYIEMYRIKTKPNSFFDFKDALVSTIDLRIENSVYNYSDKIVSDKLNPNTKYYYLFRYLNENRMPGPTSQIIEVELVNDGGYTYATFDTVDTSEFNSNKFTNKTLSFKKLLQINPNINQLLFDESGLNYNDYASNQVTNLTVGSADESLWDKKFKIRLTSKKTGKKIDLNVTHNKIIRNISKITDIEPPPPPTGVDEPSSLSTLDDATTSKALFVSGTGEATDGDYKEYPPGTIRAPAVTTSEEF